MVDMSIHNKKILKQNRKNLRNHGTPAEATLWRFLQKRQLEGRKFRRQHSVGHYILDFYCPAEKLAVELDGAHHFTAAGFEADQERDAYLRSLNIKTIRFENQEVFDNMEGVLEQIKACFDHPAYGTPPKIGGDY
ncbi:MAG: endonuclease domain-containing protein [Bacteroidota bacterium]